MRMPARITVALCVPPVHYATAVEFTNPALDNDLFKCETAARDFLSATFLSVNAVDTSGALSSSSCGN
jgi:hypothetical protein